MTNDEIKIVYQPKDKQAFGGRRRFGVGVKSLAQYITESNAEKVLTKGVNDAAQNEKLRTRMKFRKYGIIDIYLI